MPLPSAIDAHVDISLDGTGLFTGTSDRLTTYVLGEPGFTVDEGRDGAQQLSPPQVSAGDFELNNESGQFSFEQPASPYYQLLQPGKPIRYLASHGVAGDYDENADYDEALYYDGAAQILLGRHVVDDIDQNSDIGSRTVHISTLGYETVLTRAPVTVALMTNPRVDQCFTALLDAAGWPADKRAISVADTQLLYWWADEVLPWNAMLELIASEGPGTFYVDRDGVFRFENRNYRTLTARSTTSQATLLDHDTSGGLWFSAFKYSPSFKNVFNRATFSTKRRTVGALAKVWEYGATLTLTAGQVVTLFVRPTDPFTGAVSPVAATDYTVSAGSASVALTYSSGFLAIITVTAGGSGATIVGVTSTGIQLRAQPLTVVSETTVANTTDASASIAQFSPIPGAAIPLTLSVAGWTEIDPDVARAVCNAWVVRQQYPRPQVTFTIRNADGDHLEQILKRMPSDRVTLVEANSGLSADVWINQLTLTVAGAGGRVVELVVGAEKVDTVTGGIWDVSLWDAASATWGI